MLDAAPSVLQRLTEALDRFDQGNAIDIYTVAALNRTILGMGKGDRLALRLSNAFNLELPDVGLPAVTELRGPITLQIGPIPCSPKDAVRTVPLLEWLNEPAIRLPQGVMTWERFVRDFANESSSHLSLHINTELESIKLHQGPAGKMSEYLVRAAGAVAEHALSSILNQAISSDVVHRPYYVGPIRVNALVAQSDEFGFDVLFDPNAEGRVATIPFQGDIFEVRLVWDSESGTGTIVFDPRPA